MKKLTALSLMVGLMLALPYAATANLVVDESFEQGTVSGGYQTYATGPMGGWTVANGSVDLIRTYWVPSVGSQSVDMAGFYANGTIKQTITGLTSGQTYHLTFDMAGNPDDNNRGNTLKTLNATFGATTSTFTFDTTGKGLSNMGWLTKSAYFVANNGPTMDLIFTDLSTPLGTAWGSALDNVSLVAVPETSTVVAGALLLLPFGASTLRILRKRTV